MQPPRPGSDTSPDVDRIMFQHWRTATPDQKLQRVFRTGAMLNELVRADIRQRYPNATEREITLRAASRSYPRDLMIKAFGWDPLVHGL